MFSDDEQALLANLVHELSASIRYVGDAISDLAEQHRDAGDSISSSIHGTCGGDEGKNWILGIAQEMGELVSAIRSLKDSKR